MPSTDIFKYEVEVADAFEQSDAIDYGAVLVQAPEAWKVSKGAGIRVGIIDTGWSDHSDLKDGTYGRYPSVNGVDMLGHGTHVAGIIGARENGAGVIGIAPECSMYCARAVPGSWNSLNKALRYLEDNGVHIVNMSFGGKNTPTIEAQDTMRRMYRAGTVLIASAGNNRIAGQDTITYPARLPYVIPVAAIDRNAESAPFSAMGDAIELGFCMPGVDVYSTWLDNGYATLSGTSMAAPHLTGVVALMLAKHDAEGGSTPIPVHGEGRVTAVIEHLIESVKVVGDKRQFGYGYIDALKLLS